MLYYNSKMFCFLELFLAIKGDTMNLQLAGKKALITGGSRGIGKEIARHLALEGVDCVICSRNEVSLKETALELKKNGKKYLPDCSRYRRC